MARSARSRRKVLHELSEAVGVLVLAAQALRVHVTDDAEAVAILDDLAKAAERCIPLFDELRNVI